MTSGPGVSEVRDDDHLKVQSAGQQKLSASVRLQPWPGAAVLPGEKCSCGCPSDIKLRGCRRAKLLWREQPRPPSVQTCPAPAPDHGFLLFVCIGERDNGCHPVLLASEERELLQLSLPPLVATHSPSSPGEITSSFPICMLSRLSLSFLR